MKRYIFIPALLTISLLSFAQITSEQNGLVKNVSGLNTDKNEYNTVFNPTFDKMAFTYSKEYSHGDRNERAKMSVWTGTEWGQPSKMLSLCRKISHINVMAWPSEDTVYVYRGSKYGKIYQYRFNGKKWKKSDKIKLCKTRVKKACFNSDFTAIYFSTTLSKKKGGFGGEDLYVCTKGADGKWSAPVSLGEKINTWGDEVAPFLVGDSILFFASSGHTGFGGYDIFYSKLENGEWSEPVNAGEPINSDKDDAFYVTTNKDYLAYFSSNRDGGAGGMDIYSVSYIFKKELAEMFPDNKSFITGTLLSDISTQKESQLDSTRLTLMKGIVMGDDSVPLQAKISLSDLSLAQVIAEQNADVDGSYQIAMPGGANYGLTVTHPGYLFYSENFDLPEQNEYKELDKNIILKKIALGKNVALKNLFFDIDKSNLKDASIVELGNIIKFLTDNPTLHIEIQGYTDNTGSKTHNQKLSEARAKAVLDYLVEQGIDAERLTSNGYGMENPVADNSTEEGRAENRRTEILITKM